MNLSGCAEEDQREDKEEDEEDKREDGEEEKEQQEEKPGPREVVETSVGPHCEQTQKTRRRGLYSLLLSLSLSLISVRVAFALLFARSNGFRI